MPARFEIALLHVSEVFSRQLRPEIVYHNFDHTQAVLRVLDELCGEENVKEEDWGLLRIAALFHDAGFSIGESGHEEHGALMASRFMSEIGYNDDAKLIVMRCIRTTALLEPPSDLHEQIIRDADLHYLGTEDYFRQADLLRKEWELTLQKVMEDKEWYTTNIEFFNQHRFFTASAQKKYGRQKEINFKEISARLQSIGQ